MTEIDKTEWLKKRLNGIGGSEAGIVMGVSPYKSRIELWNEKVNKQINEIDNPDLKWGRLLEPLIANEYEKLTGRTLIIHKEIIWSKIYPFMFANVDRFIVSNYENKLPTAVLEIKTKSAFSDWNNEIPIYYQMQLQHYLSVTGLEKGVFAILDMGKKDLIIEDIERDEELIKTLIEEESKFWNLVQNRIPPKIEPTTSCKEFLEKHFSQSEPITIDISDNTIATEYAEKLKHIKQTRKCLEESELQCKTFFMNLMKEAEQAIGINYTITWKNDKDSMKFDIDKFKLENPELYKKYIQPKKGARRFLSKFDKE